MFLYWPGLLSGLLAFLTSSKLGGREVLPVVEEYQVKEYLIRLDVGDGIRQSSCKGTTCISSLKSNAGRSLVTREILCNLQHKQEVFTKEEDPGKQKLVSFTLFPGNIMEYFKFSWKQLLCT